MLKIHVQIFLKATLCQALEIQGSRDSRMNKTGKVHSHGTYSLVGEDKQETIIKTI